MDLEGFSKEEKLALLDLLILGMYSDAHLSLAEDAQVQQLLDSFQFRTKKERFACVDTAVTRVRRHIDTFGEARDYAIRLVCSFSSKKRRSQAFEALGELLSSESKKLNRDKKKFQAVVKKVIELT